MTALKFTEEEMENAFEEYILKMDKIKLNALNDQEIADKIFARKHYLNKRFEFTPERKEKIKRLNLQLFQLVEKAHHECIRLEKLRKVWVQEENCFHNDYELEAHVNLFCNQKHADTPLEGYSLVDEFVISFNGKTLESDPNPIHLEADNWNLKNQHPALNGLTFCYPFHCLVEHTHHLSWQDIIAIDNIWMDVKLTLQRSEDVG